ncbi:unnamed protein product [Malus baccata var. baccata]
MNIIHSTNAPAISLETVGIAENSSEAKPRRNDLLMVMTKVSLIGISLLGMPDVQQRSPPSTSIASMKDKGFQKKETLAGPRKGNEL